MQDGFLTLSRGVELKPYKPRPFKPIQFITEAELNAGVGGTAIVDVELYKNFYICSFLFQNRKFLTLEAPFNERLLSWILHNYTTVGFNSIKFDLPVIWYSYITQDTDKLQDLSRALIVEGTYPTEAAKQFGFKIHPTPHIDLIEVAPLRGSLKLYAARLHASRIQDLPYPIYEPLTPEQKEVVRHYNYNDLEDTALLFQFMRERIELRRAMAAEYELPELLSKSDAQIAEAVLNKEVSKINGSWPKKPGNQAGKTFYYQPPAYLRFETPALKELLERIVQIKFVIGETGRVLDPPELKIPVQVGDGIYRLGIGGLHSSEECVFYVADENTLIKDRDVTSYYPNLTLTLELCPQSMGRAFLTAYRVIVLSRQEDKKAKRTTAANGKKIVVNGAGGKYSDPYSTLYDPPLTIAQNITGQLDLLMLIEFYTLCGIKVISANTDGVVALVPKHLEAKYLECIQYWEQITGFQTEETTYSKYYARDVNAYFAVKEGAKTIKDVKVKGPYSEVGSQSGTQLDTNPTAQICSDAVKQLLVDGTPVEQTILNCKDFTRFITVRQCKAPGAHKDGEYIGKVIRWYYAKGQTGTINYVVNNNKVPDSDGAKLCMDLPSSFPEDINYDWYIAKALDILMDIGYTKREKQLKFF